MVHYEVRNSFLSAVVKDNITSSKLLSQGLNPIAHYDELAQFVHADQFKQFFKNMPQYDLVVYNNKTRRELPAAKAILDKLAKLSGSLTPVLPVDERGSLLGIVCESDFGIFNVEVQVLPQDCWDIRILHHVCGLFHKQFKFGMTWEKLAADPDIGNKIQRVIGVSIFDRPPPHSSFLRDHLLWYSHEPWNFGEILRHFTLQTDCGKQRGGIEFVDINLDAVSAGNFGEDISQEFRDWLDFLACAPSKTAHDIAAVKTEGVQQDYKVIADLPSDVFVRYQEEMVRTESVRHFTAARFEQGKIEGKIETARSMQNDGVERAKIAEYTGLTEEELSDHLCD